jgi:replication factor C large subunit
LWTIKYKPKRLDEVVNQTEAKTKFLKWFNGWKPRSRAALLWGPPGNGKTCTVEALANERKLDLLEMNASDVRSESSIQHVLGRTVRETPLFGAAGKIILIDEVDGMEGRMDAGGPRAIIKIIKESMFPVVLTANDPWSRQLYEIRGLCELIEFRKVPLRDAIKRLEYICKMEKIKADPKALRAIVEKNQGDLRASILDLETIAQGRKELKVEDVEALGRRERETDIFQALRGIFKSRTALSAKLSISSLDMDPNDVFWWVEANIQNEYEKPEDLARAYEALAKADLFRRRVILRQNWRMQAYMIDLMTAGVSLAKKEPYRKFTRYQRPERIAYFARSRAEREIVSGVLKKLSSRLHCSTRKIKAEYIPFLKILVEKDKKYTEKLALTLNVSKENINQLLKEF